MVKFSNSIDRSLVARLCCASYRSRGYEERCKTDLLALILLGRTLGAGLLLRLALLQESLRNEDIVLSWDGPARSD
jgi:hypothetical protein